MKRASPGSLRRLTVHVEEPRAGSFGWVLGELVNSGDWHLSRRGGQSFDTYHRAMAAGLLALQAEVPDLEQGPRATGKVAPPAADADGGVEAEADDASTAASGPAVPRAPAKPSRRRTAFGFGLVS